MSVCCHKSYLLSSEFTSFFYFSYQQFCLFILLYQYQLNVVSILDSSLTKLLYFSYIGSPLHLVSMPLHCFFIGLILSIDGIGSYKSAQVLIVDGEGNKREIVIKYYQSNENNLIADSVYMISSTCILRSGKLPQVMKPQSFLIRLLIFSYLQVLCQETMLIPFITPVSAGYLSPFKPS